LIITGISHYKRSHDFINHYLRQQKLPQNTSVGAKRATTNSES